MTILQTALDYHACGLSLVPVPPDGSRKPCVSWRQFEKRQPTIQELRKWFWDGNNGIAIIGGKVSGGLEVIDIESHKLAGEWKKRVDEAAGEELFKKLTIVKTPKGYHVYFRCENPGHNTDLARRLPTPEELKDKPHRKYYKLIETRAEGGFVVAPGSPAECHPACKEYELTKGSFDTIPTLNKEERDVLFDCSRSLNELYKEDYSSAENDRVGDIFEQQATWSEILEPLGWKQSSPGRWIRPGGSRDSAMEILGGKRIWVFSSSVVELPFEKATSKFATYAKLHCGGDFRQASRQLALEGYAPKTAPKQPTAERKEPVKREAEEKKASVLKTIRANELMTLEFPDPVWFVNYLLPEGLTILAGAPKTGKSWLALDLALSISSGATVLGDYGTTASEVLYLALEDNDRRLQRRLSVFGEEPSEGLTLCTELPKGRGRLDVLEEYLDANPNCKLVIIDTLAKFLPPQDSKSNANAYQVDYEVYSVLHELAKNRGIGLLCVTHTRKQKSSDGFDDVSGSIAITGVSDATWILRRDRTETSGSLTVTGRDIEELKLAAEFQKDTGRWILTGDARQEEARKILLTLLKHFGQDGRFTFALAKDPLGVSLASSKRVIAGLQEAGLVHRLEEVSVKTHYFCFTDKAIRMLMRD